jgi:hypothetical protein
MVSVYGFRLMQAQELDKESMGFAGIGNELAAVVKAFFVNSDYLLGVFRKADGVLSHGFRF